MSGAQRGSRVVFVGNIPYDMSEEQLIDVFREVGTVVGFRLVFDRDTGKPKGYGFCEFEDAETAASAVRNLNDKEVGGRPMRIDYADVDPVFEGRTTTMGHVEGEDIMPGRGPGGGGGGGAGRGRSMGRGGFAGGAGPGGPANRPLPPNLPAGQPLQQGTSATDAISQTLATLPPNQLLDILGQMKALVGTAPEQAKTLLNGHPQLSYALFQAMLMMNVVDPNILQRILSSGAMSGMGAEIPQGPAAGTPQMLHHQQQQPGYMNTPPMGRGQPAYSGPPPGMGGAGMGMGMGMGMNMGMNATAAAAGPAGVASLPEDQRALLEQVMMLTPDQINALPPDQREGIMQLKASLGQA